jgi:hypothetical protein
MVREVVQDDERGVLVALVHGEREDNDVDD